MNTSTQAFDEGFPDELRRLAELVDIMADRGLGFDERMDAIERVLGYKPLFDDEREEVGDARPPRERDQPACAFPPLRWRISKTNAGQSRQRTTDRHHSPGDRPMVDDSSISQDHACADHHIKPSPTNRNRQRREPPNQLRDSALPSLVQRPPRNATDHALSHRRVVPLHHFVQRSLRSLPGHAVSLIDCLSIMPRPRPP